LDEFAKELFALFFFEIQQNALLVAVHGDEIVAISRQMVRHPRVAITIAISMLDLDDFCTHMPKKHSAERTVEDVRKIHNTHTAERTRHFDPLPNTRSELPSGFFPRLRYASRSRKSSSLSGADPPIVRRRIRCGFSDS